METLFSEINSEYIYIGGVVRNLGVSIRIFSVNAATAMKWKIEKKFPENYIKISR